MPDDTFPRHPRGSHDAGHMRDWNEAARQDVCAQRMPGAVYCTRTDGHEGPHQGPAVRELEANTFGPEQAVRRGWGR